MLDVTEHIRADPPNVWLTSFYGWSPRTWGCVGFSVGGQRQKFLDATKDGALIVIYGAKAKETPEDMQGQVLGFYQSSRKIGHSHQWISPMQIERNRRLGRLDKWTDAIKCTKAFEIIKEDRPTIEEFAPETYSSQNHQYIGSQGVRLLPEEAKKLLDYEYIERPVYGENPITVTQISKLKPSKGISSAKKNTLSLLNLMAPKNFIF